MGLCNEVSNSLQNITPYLSPLSPLFNYHWPIHYCFFPKAKLYGTCIDNSTAKPWAETMSENDQRK